MVKSYARARIGAILGRLDGCVMITETSLVELGIPSPAIRDSEPSSAIFWVDARRLRRHMRKYNSYEQRRHRNHGYGFDDITPQVLSGCAVRAGIQMWDARRYRK